MSDDTIWLLRKLAHDIRGSAAVVSGALTEMTRAPADASYFAMAERGVARLQRIADLVGEVAHLRKQGIVATRVATPLRALVTRAVERASVLIPSRRVKLELTDGPDTTLELDEGLVQSAVVEVVVNALRFAKTSVRVAIEVRSGGATVSVTDDGTGFPEGHQIHFPWEGDVDGSGLGLGFARDVMAAHGGELLVSSHAPKGAHVELHFHAAVEPRHP